MSNYRGYRVWYLDNRLEGSGKIYQHLSTEGREVKKAHAGRIVSSPDGSRLARNSDLTTFNSTNVYQYHGASVSNGMASLRKVRSCPCLEFAGEEGLLSVVNGFIRSMVEEGLERKKFIKRKIG